MQDTMKLSEVAAFLGRSINQVRNYMNSGLLSPEKRGKELFFDRAAVVEFARARGIRVAEREVPQGENFLSHYMAALRTAPPGAELSYKVPELAASRA